MCQRLVINVRSTFRAAILPPDESFLVDRSLSTAPDVRSHDCHGVPLEFHGESHELDTVTFSSSNDNSAAAPKLPEIGHVETIHLSAAGHEIP